MNEQKGQLFLLLHNKKEEEKCYYSFVIIRETGSSLETKNYIHEI